MTKSTFIFVAFFLLLLLCGCASPRVRSSQSIVLIHVMYDDRLFATVLVREDGRYTYQLEREHAPEFKGRFDTNIVAGLRHLIADQGLQVTNGLGYYQYSPFNPLRQPPDAIKAAMQQFLRDRLATERKHYFRQHPKPSHSEATDSMQEKIESVWWSEASTPQELAEALNKWLSHETGVKSAIKLLGKDCIMTKQGDRPYFDVKQNRTLQPYEMTPTVCLQYRRPDGFVGLEFIQKPPSTEFGFGRAHAVPFSHEF